MKSPLVNILTPTYNCGKYIYRLLDSILLQSYPNIEMFIIDDGSTDNTKEIIDKYSELFRHKGYQLNYIYKSNQGQSYAINNGLKLLNGDYLFWPDADDWYSDPDSIKLLVNALHNTSDQIGIVRCNYNFYDEQSFKLIETSQIQSTNNPDYILNDCIFLKNDFRWEPGGYGIKLKFIDRFIPNREIITNKGIGQNAQMLIPYLAKSKCLTLTEPLFNYLIRQNSHSRNNDYEIAKKRDLGHMNLIIKLLDDNLPNSNHLTSLKQHIYHTYLYKLYSVSIKNKNIQDIKCFYHRLKNTDFHFSKQDLLYFYSTHMIYGPSILDCILKLVHRKRF